MNEIIIAREGQPVYRQVWNLKQVYVPGRDCFVPRNDGEQAKGAEILLLMNEISRCTRNDGNLVG